MGSQALYKWINNNPSLTFLDIEYVNNVHSSSKHNALTAINSCIEIDLTGQAVSDSIGSRIYSGVGGQIDFIRAASKSAVVMWRCCGVAMVLIQRLWCVYCVGLCPNGKPILALPSRTGKGKSRIT